jgi:hypothetical protein
MMIHQFASLEYDDLFWAGSNFGIIKIFMEIVRICEQTIKFEIRVISVLLNVRISGDTPEVLFD